MTEKRNALKWRKCQFDCLRFSTDFVSLTLRYESTTHNHFFGLFFKKQIIIKIIICWPKKKKIKIIIISSVFFVTLIITKYKNTTITLKINHRRQISVNTKTNFCNQILNSNIMLFSSSLFFLEFYTLSQMYANMFFL